MYQRTEFTPSIMLSLTTYVLFEQAKLFLEHMHEAYMASLLTALNAERWSAVEVSPERQAEVDRLTGGKTHTSTLSR